MDACSPLGLQEREISNPCLLQAVYFRKWLITNSEPGKATSCPQGLEVLHLRLLWLPCFWSVCLPHRGLAYSCVSSALK